MMCVAYNIFLLDIAVLRVNEVPGTQGDGRCHLNSYLISVCSSNTGCLWKSRWFGKQFLWHWATSETSELILDCVEGWATRRGVGVGVGRQPAPSGFVLNATPKCWRHPCWVQPPGKQWGTDWQPLRKWNRTSQIRHQGRIFIKQASGLLALQLRGGLALRTFTACDCVIVSHPI